MAAENPSFLASTIGPYLQIWQSLSPEQKAVVGGSAAVLVGLGFVLYRMYEKAQKEEEHLDATDWEERNDDMIKMPTATTGSPEKVLLINQSTSAGKRTIGRIKKAMETSTGINSEPLQEAVDDLDDVELEDVDTNVEAVSYEVIPGRTRLKRTVNKLLYELYSLVTSGSNPAADYYDLPDNAVQVTDRGIVIKDKVHIIKQNGLYQSASWRQQERIAQLSHLATHQNWLESLQKLPEFYSDLNMDVSGTKNVMNQKSQNMRQYKKSEREQEVKDAMN